MNIYDTYLRVGKHQPKMSGGRDSGIQVILQWLVVSTHQNYSSNGIIIPTRMEHEWFLHDWNHQVIIGSYPSYIYISYPHV